MENTENHVIARSVATWQSVSMPLKAAQCVTLQENGFPRAYGPRNDVEVNYRRRSFAIFSPLGSSRQSSLVMDFISTTHTK